MHKTNLKKNRNRSEEFIKDNDNLQSAERLLFYKI